MNPAVILSLIASLYEEAITCRERIAELEEENAKLREAMS